MINFVFSNIIIIIIICIIVKMAFFMPFSTSDISHPAPSLLMLSLGLARRADCKASNTRLYTIVPLGPRQPQTAVPPPPPPPAGEASVNNIGQDDREPCQFAQHGLFIRRLRFLSTSEWLFIRDVQCIIHTVYLSTDCLYMELWCPSHLTVCTCSRQLYHDV